MESTGSIADAEAAATRNPANVNRNRRNPHSLTSHLSPLTLTLILALTPTPSPNTLTLT